MVTELGLVCIGREPEPKLSHFVGTVVVACPKACSCLFSVWVLEVFCPQPGVTSQCCGGGRAPVFAS